MEEEKEISLQRQSVMIENLPNCVPLVMGGGGERGDVTVVPVFLCCLGSHWFLWL